MPYLYYKMFTVVENLTCSSNTHQNEEIDNIINYGIVYVVQDIDRYDFYMFDEASAENLTNTLDGTRLYDHAFKPNAINWYARNNKLVFLHQYTEDIFPISTLKCVLDNVSTYNNININGSVVVIDTVYYSVYYYNILDNIIYKHYNKSEDLTKFYDLTLELYENRNPTDKEFIDILQKSFPRNNYIEYLNTNGVINFLKVLAKNV